MRRIGLLLLIGFLGHAGPLVGQSAEQDVMAVLTQLFDGMRAGDSAAVRAAFHPGARLATALERAGTTLLQEGSLDRFVQAVGTPHDEVWDERLGDTDVRVDGPMASVWAPYAFYLGSTFHHCGVNAIQLFQSPEGWRIVHLIDTRQTEGCPSAE